MELNDTERRVLWRATMVVAAGAVLRVAFAPSPADLQWMPADSGGADRPTLDSQRREVAAAVQRRERASRPLAPGERLPVNEAPAVELERLSGVGPVLARRIVEERQRRGGYRTLDELSEVSGIGPKILARIRPHLRVP